MTFPCCFRIVIIFLFINIGFAADPQVWNEYNLSDVNFQSMQIGQVPRWSGKIWKNSFIDTNDLSDIAIKNPVRGQSLHHTGTNWVNQSGVINVLDFGADPTGKTDSTTAINKALEAANSGYNSEIGFDNWFPIQLEPTIQGGTIYFPKGEYSISKTLIARNVRIIGSLGTEIQARSYGTYIDGAIFQLYGHCVIDSICLDLFSGYDASGNDFDNETERPHLTWFVAKSDLGVGTDPNNGLYGTVHIQNIETSLYGPFAECFYRNDTFAARLYFSTSHFYTWKYGLHFRGSYQTFQLSDIRGDGIFQTNESDFVSGSAFILSEAGAIFPSHYITLNQCRAEGYENAILYRDGGKDPAQLHVVSMTGCAFEGIKYSVHAEGMAIPSLRATNCSFQAYAFNVLAESKGPPASLEMKWRSLQFDHCMFIFEHDLRRGILNDHHIFLNQRSIPLIVNGCIFTEPYTKYEAPDEMVMVMDNRMQVIFSNNTFRTINPNSSNVYSGIIAPLRFHNNHGVSIVCNGNNIEMQGGNGFSICVDGAWKYFTAIGNHTNGPIHVQAGGLQSIVEHNTLGQ